MERLSEYELLNRAISEGLDFLGRGEGGSLDVGVMGRDMFCWVNELSVFVPMHCLEHPVGG